MLTLEWFLKWKIWQLLGREDVNEEQTCSSEKRLPICSSLVTVESLVVYSSSPRSAVAVLSREILTNLASRMGEATSSMKNNLRSFEKID